jgi:hypothetical protein
MRLLLFGWQLFGKIINLIIISSLFGSTLFIWYRGNQPMSVIQAPKDLTYWEFMADRIDAAKMVQPTRCGWGMISSLLILGPIYSVLYTVTAVNPDGFIARITAPDLDIPKHVGGSGLYKIPGIWWSIVEHLSWTMLEGQHPGCRFRPIERRTKSS